MDNFNTGINDQVSKAKSFFSGPKIIFAILGIILLAEVIYAVWVLNSSVSVSSPPPAQKAIQAQAGKISLNASKTKIKVGEVTPVSVLVDTGSQTIDGVDLIVKYDPKVLEATQGGLIKGSILDEYPLMSVDAAKGLISISGVSNTKDGFKGVGQFATINFKAKKAGQSVLTIDFQKGLTTDSNIVEAGTSVDILEVVDDLDLEVQ